MAVKSLPSPLLCFWDGTQSEFFEIGILVCKNKTVDKLANSRLWEPTSIPDLEPSLQPTAIPR